ncbi:LuxE/PaaK family acyltransferase [Pararhodonellum marinum]|uniref:LuxE/PaaK family acyltransferase n=1 Tax=Pararhodonellum marinum TaxID=2755358 RepID=UPI00188ED078|nr:acyl transferase [Pararhodonellum marinum]
MTIFKSFVEKVQSWVSTGHEKSPQEFEALAMELFYFQAEANPVYRQYLSARKIDPASIQSIQNIPYLPIGFFKSHAVISGREADFSKFYASSGTTGVITSRHYIWNEAFYLQHSKRLFEQQYGALSDFHILALLPAYLERKDSSLVAMADFFIQESQSPISGFYLYEQKELIEKLIAIRDDSRKVLLLGVTFALLDLSESGFALPKMSNLTVMETGGMKGRRKEMIREEVHERLKVFFQVEAIHSEYGMTELLSQAYSKGDGKYTMPPSMQVSLREINDPFSPSHRSQGGINLIDLANFHSCAFLETQDLGRVDDKGFLEVLGRIDNSEIRGCNLMVN